MINILVVEDQALVRKHLEQNIELNADYQLAGAISNAAYAEAFCAQKQVDLILMDVCTDFDEDGIEAAAIIKKRFPKIKVIIMTSMVEIGYLDRAKKTKADSFWYKDSSENALEDVIARTMNGESVYPDQTPEVKVGLIYSSEFTAAEKRVLRVLCEGLSFKEMAEELGIEVSTVRYHVDNMLQKTGYPNKNRLAIAVTKKNLIRPTPDRDLERE